MWCRQSTGHQGEHQTAASLAASLRWPKDIPRIHWEKVFHLSLCLCFLWFPAYSRIHDLKVRQLSVASLWLSSPVISCQMCLGPPRAAGDRFGLGAGGGGEWNQHDASYCPSQLHMISLSREIFTGGAGENGQSPSHSSSCGGPRTWLPKLCAPWWTRNLHSLTS